MEVLSYRRVTDPHVRHSFLVNCRHLFDYSFSSEERVGVPLCPSLPHVSFVVVSRAFRRREVRLAPTPRDGVVPIE